MTFSLMGGLGKAPIEGLGGGWGGDVA
jgi:hypothetical protein